MEIKTIKNKTVWENFITVNSPQSFFQSWTWGEVYKKSGLPVWRFGIYNRSILEGIFQLKLVRARRGRYLHIRHGPIFKNQTQILWITFLTYIRKLAAEQNGWFVRLSPLIDDTSQNNLNLQRLGLAPSPIHALDGEICWVLDIKKSEEELLLDMRKTTRYDIRRGLKLPITIKRSYSTELLPEFFRLYQATAARQGFVQHSDIQSEVEFFAKDNRSLILLGSVDGAPAASAIIVFYGNQAIYRHGASVHGPYPISHLIQWEAIREARKKLLQFYNFWGIADDKNINHKLLQFYNFWGIADDKNINHKWKGITQFKTGFGGRKISYIHSHDYILSKKYYFTFVVEKIRKKLQGY